MIMHRTSAEPATEASAAPVRERAEAVARTRKSLTPQQIATLAPDESQALIHELHVHQIELEMQNEELRRTQTELQVSRARYFELYDLAPVGYLSINEAGLIQEANLTASNLLGFPRNKLPATPLTQFILHTDQDIYYQHRKQLFETGEPQTCEMRILKPNGTSFWAHLTATAVELPDGSRSCRVVMSDITDRKLIEEELQDSESKFRALFEKGPIGVAYHKMIYDAAGKPVDYYFLDANLSYQQLTGVDPRGKTVTQAFPGIEHDTTDWIGIFGKVARTGESIRFESYLSLNDHWYDCVGYQYQPDHFVAAFLDITDRKKAEEALHKSITLLDITQRLSHVGGWEWDVDKKRMTWTEETYRIHDLNPEKFDLGAPDTIPNCVNFYDPADRQVIAQSFQHCVSDGEPYDHEFPFTNASGRRLWIRTTAHPIRDNTGRIIRVVGNIQDVTDRKRIDAELLKLQKLESVGTLAGGIAHDFNNIMMGLFGNISIAKNELSRESPAYKPLEDAEKCMGRAIRLTKQLLTFAKGGDPVKEEVSLGALVEEVARFDLSGSNVMLAFSQAPDLWRVQADKGQIQQVISNLTINAREAMPNGGHLTINLENVEVKTDTVPGLPHGKFIKITVRDLGIGIDPKCIDRIFDPYFTTKQTGSGLGLATTYSIITKHEGHIEVESELGKGTTFTFYLPASATQPQLPATPSLTRKSPIQASTRILVLDDEDFIRMVIPRWLKSTGCFVATTDEGTHAIELYKQAFDSGHPFDLAILDLTVPGGIGGTEVLKAILAINPRAKALASSGYADGTIMSNYSAHGFIGIIAKPYTEDQLHDVLEQALTGPPNAAV